jgi:hypothetical protein
MTNIFEETYTKIQQIKTAFNNATTDDEREEARKEMKIITDSFKAKSLCVNRIMDEYEVSRDSGNEILNIRSFISENQVDEFISVLKDNGINEFTFSNSSTGALENAWKFQEAGYKLQGIIEINSEYKKFFSDEYEKIHAYLFRA